MPSACCASRTSCGPGSGRSTTSARRCRSSAPPARRATTRATRPRARWPARSATRLRDHHRRRPGDHGGGEPRRARRRRPVGRPRHRPAGRAGAERLGRRRAQLPLLLRAQGDVRPLRERLRRVPRRVRDARRAVRGGDAAPDREDPLLPDRARRPGLLGRARRLAAGLRAHRREHQRPATSARCRCATTRATSCASSRTSSTAARGRLEARRSGFPAARSRGRTGA